MTLGLHASFFTLFILATQNQNTHSRHQAGGCHSPHSQRHCPLPPLMTPFFVALNLAPALGRSSTSQSAIHCVDHTLTVNDLDTTPSITLNAPCHHTPLPRNIKYGSLLGKQGSGNPTTFLPSVSALDMEKETITAGHIRQNIGSNLHLHF